MARSNSSNSTKSQIAIALGTAVAVAGTFMALRDKPVAQVTPEQQKMIEAVHSAAKNPKLHGIDEVTEDNDTLYLNPAETKKQEAEIIKEIKDGVFKSITTHKDPPSQKELDGPPRDKKSKSVLPRKPGGAALNA